MMERLPRSGNDGSFMYNRSFVAYFTLRVSHMIGTDLVPANITDDGIFEILMQELESYVIHPWAWIETDFDVPFYAFLVPTLALLTLFTNAVIFFIFVKHKLYSPVNILMIGIAIADTFTVLLPSPFLIYMYFSGHAPFIPENMCRTYDYLGKYLPEITHTASIWLTMALSCQRFISVCKPFYARRICTKKTSIRMIIIVLICSFMLHLSRFLDTKYIKLIIHDNEDVGNNITTCKGVHVDVLADYSIEYECAYYWTVIIVVKLIPFVTTITLDVLMAKTIRTSVKDGRKVSATLRNSMYRKRKNESVRVTWIIIIVTVTIVLVETPLMITLILWTLTMIHQRLFISEQMLGTLSIIFNLMIYVSFPCILLLYCTMSHKFRREICHILKCCKGIPWMKRKSTVSKENSVEMERFT